MKSLLFLLIAAISVSAQTNFYSLLECVGATYTNATISQVTPAYATVTFHGGVVQVPLRDMPVAIQQKYHYDSNAAALYLADKKRKSDKARRETAARQAAYERSLTAQAGSAQNIQITAILDETTHGGLPLCAVGFTGGWNLDAIDPVPSRLLLKNLPAEVRTFIYSRAKLKADIVNLEARPISVTSRAKVNYSDGSPDPVSSQILAQNAASDALYDAKEAREKQLEQLKRQLVDMEESEFDHTVIQAYRTGQTFGGYEVWQAMGMGQRNRN